MLDIQRPDLVAGVAGSGTMGRGIVQVLAQCGVRTLVFDAKPGAAQGEGRDRQVPGRASCRRARHPGRRGRGARAHRDRRFARRAQALPRGGRGDRRAARAEAGTVQGARGGRLRDLHPRLQHLVAVGDRDGLGLREARARRRLPLLQPGAGDENRRSGGRRTHRALGGRRAGRAREALRPQAGALQGHAGLHRQPRRPRLRAGEPARAAGGRRRLRHHRPDPRGRGGIPPRAVRAARPGRPRHRARRDEVHARAVLRRAEVPALLPLRSARRGGIAGTKDGQGLVQVREGRGCGENS